MYTTFTGQGGVRNNFQCIANHEIVITATVIVTKKRNSFKEFILLVISEFQHFSLVQKIRSGIYNAGEPGSIRAGVSTHPKRLGRF